MTMTMQHARLAATLLALSCAPLAAAAGELDILACGSGEKQAVSPTDPLKCEWKNGLFEATLAQLYSQGWRMADAVFFDHVRPVLYLERPVGAVAP
jgi:hypothetical protein